MTFLWQLEQIVFSGTVKQISPHFFLYNKVNHSKNHFIVRLEDTVMITQLPTEQISEFHPVIPTSNSSLKLNIPGASWRIPISNKQPSRVFLLTSSNSLHNHLSFRSLQARIPHPHIYQTGHLGVLHTSKSWRTALPSVESALGASTAASLMKALSLSRIVPFMLGMGLLLRKFTGMPELRWSVPQR